MQFDQVKHINEAEARSYNFQLHTDEAQSSFSTRKLTMPSVFPDIISAFRQKNAAHERQREQDLADALARRDRHNERRARRRIQADSRKDGRKK